MNVHPKNTDVVFDKMGQKSEEGEVDKYKHEHIQIQINPNTNSDVAFGKMGQESKEGELE